MAQDPQKVLARFAQMKSDRAVSETYWQGVADYMLPSREFTRHSVPGSTRTAPLIFNTSPINALEQLAGALHGMLTSPSLRWFKLRAADPAMIDDDDVAAWFDDATERMYAVFTAAHSGFDTSLHELYLDLVGMGTGCIYIADGKRHGPRFEARPLAEIFVQQNANGQIDTLIRSYQLPAREVVALWPKTAPSEMVDLAARAPDAKQDLLHAVIPNDARTGWDSSYILASKKLELDAGQYSSFPFATPRWMKRSGETYGFGPGMSVLPDVRLLNKLEELNLRGLAKVVDPALLLPDDGFLNSPTTEPGKFVYFRSGTPNLDKIGPLVTGSRPDLGKEFIMMIQDRIDRGFYVTWMNLPSQPNMTATEILQRRDEMLRLLGPMVSRVTAELLGPVIERTFAIMAANQMLAPLPQALAGHGYAVEYLSPLATAQKAGDAEAVMRWFAAVAQLAQVDPSVTDVVDSQAAARFLASRLGAPASVVRSKADIATRQQQQEQQAQQEHEMQATQAAATAANQGTGALANIAQAMQTAGQTAGPGPANGMPPAPAAAA